MSWIAGIDMLLDDPTQSGEVIMAARASGETVAQDVLDGLQNLRDLGVAEPD